MIIEVDFGSGSSSQSEEGFIEDFGQEYADDSTPDNLTDSGDTGTDPDNAADGDDTASDSGDGADNGNTPEDSTDSDNGDSISEVAEDGIRFNFGPPVPSSNDGTIQDIGTEFSEDRGFGWVTQASAGGNNPVPVNIQANTRDRNLIEQADLDSFVHLQYSDDFTQPNAATTPAAWEYELENGKYTVTVAVGDPEFTDSNHVINLEGESVVSGFTPTDEDLFRESTTVVEVTDGKLTIDAIGGDNTKLDYVEIIPADDSAVVGATINLPANVTPIERPTSVGIPIEGGGVVQPVQPVADGININFGNPSTRPPSGFTQDIGEAYNSEQGYGWVTQDSSDANPTPINLIPNGRDRDTLFNDGQGSLVEIPVKDSLIHMQYPTGLENSSNMETTPAAWEYDLEDGTYEVTVGVGDPEFFNSTHAINVEGESLISGFTPTGFEVNGFLPLGAQAFSEGSAIVEVEDDRLTIDAIGGENTKINYVSIVSVDV